MLNKLWPCGVGELWPSWRGGIIINAAQPSMWGEEYYAGDGVNAS